MLHDVRTLPAPAAPARPPPMIDSATTATTAAASQPGSMARNAFYLLVGQVLSTALSIALSAVLGRRLGAAEFGVYYVLAAMWSFAYVFIDWGQSAYLIREAARRPGAAGALLGGSLAFRSAVAAAAALVTGLLARLIGYDMRTQALAVLTVLCGLPLALSQPYGYLFRGRDRMDLDATVTVTAKALIVALTVPALLLGGGLPTVIVIQAVGGAAALAVAVLLARHVRLFAARPDRATIRELASGGAPIAIFFIAISVQPYLDAIVLSKLAPAVAVGWYGAARNIMGVLTAPASILATAAFPELSRVSSSTPDLRRAIRAALRPLVALGALGAVGTFLFANFAVTLIYGRGRFDPAATVLQVFAPALLLFFVDILLGTTITAVGKTREMALVKLLSVGASTGLALLLVPVCQDRLGNGGVGLVLAFGSTEVLMLASFLLLLPRGSLDGATFLDFGRAVLSGAGTLALVRALPALTPWVTLPAAVGAYAGLALATGLLRRDEVSAALRMVRRKYDTVLRRARGA